MDGVAGVIVSKVSTHLPKSRRTYRSLHASDFMRCVSGRLIIATGIQHEWDYGEIL